MTSHRRREARPARTWTWIAGIVCAAAWLPFAGGCSQVQPSRAELETAVYVAVLDLVYAEDTMPRLRTLLAPDTGTRIVRVYHSRDTLPKLVLVDRVSADPVRWLIMLMGMPDPPADSVAAARRELERRKIPRELAEDFVAANPRPDSLSVPIAARPPAYFATLPPMSLEERAALFDGRRGDPRRDFGLPAYPRPNQVLQLSRAGFSPDRRHALVYVETYCGVLCAGGILVRLSHGGERWRVVEMLNLWVS